MYMKFIFYNSMNKKETSNIPCCNYINQLLLPQLNTKNQLITTLDKELKYEKNKKEITKYIESLHEEEKE